MSHTLVIIGAGLSGLAAGIRYARFGHKVIILEKHSIAGGLNSYYYRQGMLLETGLHAMTNYAAPEDKAAPLNRLFRQLKLSRRQLATHEQFSSKILFPGNTSLLFSNDFTLLQEEVARLFPRVIDRFNHLVSVVDDYDPFTPKPRISTRQKLDEFLGDRLLIDMLLWPLMVYGNSEEHDMDFSQFVIMFRSIFQEGMFRPAGTVKDFLNVLIDHYKALGGEIRFKTAVESLKLVGTKVLGVYLESGEFMQVDDVISTAGYPATLGFTGDSALAAPYEGQMSFTEMVYFLTPEARHSLQCDQTIIFYNLAEQFDYCRPLQAVNVDCGVICFPGNFKGLPPDDPFQLRVTHPANYSIWQQADAPQYKWMKEEWGARSRRITGEIIGNYEQNIVYQDSFTPVTIEKFTGKAQGAVYGSPVKLKDGRTAYDNLYVAGTDQGYLGIVGAMLSGVTMINHHILDKI
ncbi:MAG: FAD-dependent oxidoreductase [Proteobacteria bacterium]|nr:FAD-dependent oxidoreductase [Pseudomonadota bacterium]MBU1714120.1 FAD-dependent oxidoreductase [Pseudomonadota bacterium]